MRAIFATLLALTVDIAYAACDDSLPATATLLTAKINGMPIKQLNYSIPNYLCIITSVWIGS